MNTAHHSRDEERLQRALNDVRRQTLTERFGACFGNEDGDVPAEVEARWLDCVEEFETRLQDAEEVTVREYIGNPTFKLLASIPRSELEAEINVILAFLYRYQIRVDFLAEVSDEDAYRFLTSELMDQEVEDVHIDGLYTCFVYEQFHRNDRYDATEAVKDFLWHLFSRRTDYIDLHFSRNGMQNPAGAAVSALHMKALVSEWIASIALFTTHITKVSACLVDRDDAIVRADVRWSGLAAQTFTERSGSGEALFRLRRSPTGFDIVQLSVPGF